MAPIAVPEEDPPSITLGAVRDNLVLVGRVLRRIQMIQVAGPLAVFNLKVVITGLDPVIHAFRHTDRAGGFVDGRIKSGHDE